MPKGKYTSLRDEEELVDYEPAAEKLASFSPVEDELSVLDYNTSAHGDGPASNIVVDTEILVYLGEGSNVAGRKRRQTFPEEGERSRKASRAGCDVTYSQVQLAIKDLVMLKRVTGLP